ncbi:MAG: MogA/MoaB family molybdenum cofactor biosynthesis protein [Planctomycetes bacterium]|nr:MogA/MoaB family molybdenum cofactor biosynthesis protein [Planctomycetota bacterium]MCC7172884.1 MogA/MoaB family molybdenum cofactor biosynthesis protein [Planctomycetota bacterium]
MKAVVVIVSDRRSKGEAKDETAPRLAALLAAAGFELLPVIIVPDERDAIAAALRDAAARCELVVSSGGTGIGPRDVTPEATRDVLDKEIPGFGEAMRAVSRSKTPFADLSRATAGTCGSAMVVNLPGSPKGAEECLGAVLPPVMHGLKSLAGAVKDCQVEVARELRTPRA